MARLASALFQLLSASAALRSGILYKPSGSIAGRLVPCTCIAMPLCCSVSASAHISPETVDNIRSSERILSHKQSYNAKKSHICVLLDPFRDDVLRYLVASAGDL